MLITIVCTALASLGVVSLWNSRRQKIEPPPAAPKVVSPEADPAAPLNWQNLSTFNEFLARPQVRRCTYPAHVILGENFHHALTMTYIQSVLDFGCREERIHCPMRTELVASLAAIYAVLAGRARYALLVKNVWGECHALATEVRECLALMGVAYKNGPRGQILVGPGVIRTAPIHRLAWFLSGKPDFVFVVKCDVATLDTTPEPYRTQTREILAGLRPAAPRSIIAF